MTQARTTRAERFALWSMARWRWLLGLGALLLVISGCRTVLTYGSLRSELEELLPQSAPSVSTLSELRRRIPGIRSLGVVLELDEPSRATDAEQFLDHLAARIRAYPPELVRSVRTDTVAERRFAERYALQLMDPDDVRKLREAVEARRDFEVSRAMGTDLDEDDADRKPPNLPLEELKQKYQTRFAADVARKSDRFVSPDGRNMALLVQTNSQLSGYESDQRLLANVIRDVATLGGVPAGTRLGYAGDVATRVEETRGLAADLGISSVVVGLLVVSSLLWFYRSWAALVALFVPLTLGTCLGFAIVALPPLSIRYLNTNTAFLGSIVIGNGINSGIMLLARIQEELAKGQSVREAAATGVSHSFRATLAAALASAAAYGSLVFTEFRGFNQFGWIGSIGIMMCWAATYALMPPLCLLLGGRLRPRPARQGARPASMQPSLSTRLSAFTMRHRRVVLLALLAFGVVSVTGLSVRRDDWIEYDLSKLRRKDSWENGERYWGKRLDAATGRYLTPTVVMTQRPNDVAVVERRLRAIMQSGGAGNLIAEVRTAQQLLPETRHAAIEEARRLKAAITPLLRSKLSESERQQLDSALSAASFVPLQADDLPEAFAAGLRERDGQVGRTVLVFPKVGGGTWVADRLTGFSRDLRAVAGEVGATAAGPLLLSSDLADAMRADGPRVTLVSFACVLAICIGAFGVVSRQAWVFSGLAIGTLLLGVSYMLGLLAWTGAKLNFSNFVALPITFGIGADYAINMLRRFQSEGQSSGEGLSETSGALALCSAMTVAGWGALLLAENQALFSFGLFAISGELTSLGAAVLALPAVLAGLSTWSPRSRLTRQNEAKAE